MNDFFQSSTLATLFAIGIYSASAFTMVLGIGTVRKLSPRRNVARAIGVLISLTAFITLCAGFMPKQVEANNNPFQLTQVLQVLGMLINILVLKLLTKPCYPERDCDGTVRPSREIA